MKIILTAPKKTEQERREAHAQISADDLPETARTSLRDKLLGTVILIAVTALFLWFSVLLCRPIFLLASSPDQFENFIREQGAMGRFAFLGIQILQGFLPIPLELTAVAGGYAFGRVQGTLLTICATMISTTAIFYFTRIFGHRVMNLFFTRTQQRHAKYFHDERVRTTVTWIVFLIPGTPKRIFVFSAGLVPQKFGNFLVISTLARIPSLLACSFGGQALGTGNYGQATAIFVVVGLLSIAGVAAYQILSEKRSRPRKHSKNLTR